MSTDAAPHSDAREGGLLAWQWRGYPTFHADRTNLAIHLVTAPLFWLGLVSLVAGVLFDRRCALGGVGILVALIAQGRGHRIEAAPPLPFRGPADLAARFLCEQMINFPRFVISGGWWMAWRAAGSLEHRRADHRSDGK